MQSELCSVQIRLNSGKNSGKIRSPSRLSIELVIPYDSIVRDD